MTCHICKGTGAVIRERRHYVVCGLCGGLGCNWCGGYGSRVEVGPVADACPSCAAEAEAEWWALTLQPLVPEVAAE